MPSGAIDGKSCHPFGTLYTYTLFSSFRSSVDCLHIMLKIHGAITPPCFMPLAMGKGPDSSPLSLIWTHWFSCSRITICRKLMDTHSCFRTCHSPVLPTESKALMRLTKVVETLVLFSSLLLELTYDEHHVCHASVGSCQQWMIPGIWRNQSFHPCSCTGL